MNPMSIMEDQVFGILRDAIAMAPQFLVALFILVLAWLTAKVGRAVIGRTLRSSRLRPSLKDLIGLLFSIAVWLFGIMVAAIVIFPNLTPASVLAGLGLGSVALGFAFKDIFENFLAGVIILFRREMRIGDFIECEDLEGVVERISVRESHIRRTDGQLVIVPNSLLFKNPLTIRTDLETRRTTIICGIAYGEDVDKGRETIKAAVEACETVRTDDKPVQIFAQEFAASSINYEVTWWTGSRPVDIRRSRDEVVAAVKRALDEAGIEIPFPYRTLTFKEDLGILPRQSETGSSSSD